MYKYKTEIIILLCIVIISFIGAMMLAEDSFWDEYIGYEADKFYRDFPNFEYKLFRTTRSSYMINYGPYRITINKETNRIEEIIGSQVSLFRLKRTSVY